MQFLESWRDRIRSGEITSSIRLWQRPHVRVGGRYSLPPGEIMVTSLLEMSLADVTPELARRSGFVGVVQAFRCWISLAGLLPLSCPGSLVLKLCSSRKTRPVYS